MFRSRRAPIAAVVSRMVGVPPDAGIDTGLAQMLQSFQWQPFAIRQQTIPGHQVRPDACDRARLFFAGMAVNTLGLGVTMWVL